MNLIATDASCLPPKNKERFALRGREVASPEGLLQIPDSCTVSIKVLLFKHINEAGTARLGRKECVCGMVS